MINRVQRFQLPETPVLRDARTTVWPWGALCGFLNPPPHTQEQPKSLSDLSPAPLSSIRVSSFHLGLSHAPQFLFRRWNNLKYRTHNIWKRRKKRNLSADLIETSIQLVKLRQLSYNYERPPSSNQTERLARSSNS